MNENGDTKIYLITCVIDREVKEGHLVPCKPYTVVSHGVGNNSMVNYCLPCEHPNLFSPKYDTNGMYIDAVKG